VHSKKLINLMVTVMLLILNGLYKVLLYVVLIKIFTGDSLLDSMSLNMLPMSSISELILDGELYST